MKPLLFTALSLIAALAFALSAARLLSGLLAAGRNRKAKAHAQTTEKAVPSGRRARMRALILTAVFGWIAVYALPRSGLALLRPATTTVGQLCGELTALPNQTPTALVYTEHSGAPETLTVTVDDPALVSRALDIILSAAVDPRGCQVDMYWLQYEEYRFVFGGNDVTFSFIPSSYFCYDGQYYELGENQLGRVRDLLHERAEAEAPAQPQSKWYGEDAELRTRFVDNGDEARSVTELTLSAGGKSLEGVIEGAYEVLSVDRQPDGYVIRYTYGDFYSHEAIRSSRITVENGKMIITGIAQ